MLFHHTTIYTRPKQTLYIFNHLRYVTLNIMKDRYISHLQYGPNIRQSNRTKLNMDNILTNALPTILLGMSLQSINKGITNAKSLQHL